MYTTDTSNHFLVQILKCSYLQLTDLIIRSRSFFPTFIRRLIFRGLFCARFWVISQLAQLSDVHTPGNVLWCVKIEAFCFVF